MTGQAYPLVMARPEPGGCGRMSSMSAVARRAGLRGLLPSFPRRFDKWAREVRLNGSNLETIHRRTEVALVTIRISFSGQTVTDAHQIFSGVKCNQQLNAAYFLGNLQKVKMVAIVELPVATLSTGLSPKSVD
jgi:hypothetical protein